MRRTRTEVRINIRFMFRSVKCYIVYICASAPPVGNLSRGSLEDSRRSFKHVLLSCSPYSPALFFRGKPAHVTIMEGKIYTPAPKKKKKERKKEKKISLQATSPTG